MIRFDDLIRPEFNPYNQNKYDPESTINPWLKDPLIMQDNGNLTPLTPLVMKAVKTTTATLKSPAMAD